MQKEISSCLHSHLYTYFLHQSQACYLVFTLQYSYYIPCSLLHHRIVPFTNHFKVEWDHAFTAVLSHVARTGAVGEVQHLKIL